MREKVTKKFPVANLGYQLKNQVARGNFQWSMGYQATINTYSVIWPFECFKNNSVNK